MLTFRLSVGWYNWKNFAVAGTKIGFFLCLDIALDIALQGACPGSERSERARVAPAGQSRLLLHSGKGLRLKCRLGFTHKACVWTSSDVLKVEVCDSLHSVCVEQFGLHSWKLWERWPKDDLLGFPEWEGKDRKALCLELSVALGQAPCWKRLENSRVFINDWCARQGAPDQNWHSWFILINDRLVTSPTEI